MNSRAADRATALLGGLAVAGAWAIYLPLGVKYAFYLGSGLLAGIVLWRARRLGSLLHWPPFVAPLLLWGLLLMSALWSSAQTADILSHLWHYGRVLVLPVIALALPPEAARRGLVHFVWASAVVALLTTLDRLHAVPLDLVLSTTASADGNQRIVTSLLLALGVALAVLQMVDATQTRRQRLGWLAIGVVTAIGLSLQDRRTGMVALPLLLAALTVTRQRSWWRSSLMVGCVALMAVLAWQASSSVRGRFAEGLGELQAYRSTGVVDTSWGMRMRMVELTLGMVHDKPVLGHGIASWIGLWRERAKGGGELLERQTTPHNEYLLIACQVGLAGTALWLAMLATYLAQAWRAGRRGDASLLVWTAIAWTAMFSVTLRDAKFAMALLLLASLALAASRPPQAGTQTGPAGH